MIRPLAVTALILASLAVGPLANAVPGDPMPGCETNLLGGVYCDGPIRPDGTFQRCTYVAGSYIGGQYPSWVPPVTTCMIIDNSNWPALPPWVPNHHIDS